MDQEDDLLIDGSLDKRVQGPLPRGSETPPALKSDIYLDDPLSGEATDSILLAKAFFAGSPERTEHPREVCT